MKRKSKSWLGGYTLEAGTDPMTHPPQCNCNRILLCYCYWDTDCVECRLTLARHSATIHRNNIIEDIHLDNDTELWVLQRSLLQNHCFVYLRHDQKKTILHTRKEPKDHSRSRAGQCSVDLLYSGPDQRDATAMLLLTISVTHSKSVWNRSFACRKGSPVRRLCRNWLSDSVWPTDRVINQASSSALHCEDYEFYCISCKSHVYNHLQPFIELRTINDLLAWWRSAIIIVWHSISES